MTMQIFFEEIWKKNNQELKRGEILNLIKIFSDI